MEQPAEWFFASLAIPEIARPHKVVISTPDQLEEFRVPIEQDRNSVYPLIELEISPSETTRANDLCQTTIQFIKDTATHVEVLLLKKMTFQASQSHLPHTSKMAESKNPPVDVNSLVELLRGCSENLRGLNFQGCFFDTWRGFVALVTAVPHLKHLSLESTRWDDDLAVAYNAGLKFDPIKFEELTVSHGTPEQLQIISNWVVMTKDCPLHTLDLSRLATCRELPLTQKILNAIGRNLRRFAFGIRGSYRENVERESEGGVFRFISLANNTELKHLRIIIQDEDYEWVPQLILTLHVDTPLETVEFSLALLRKTQLNRAAWNEILNVVTYYPSLPCLVFSYEGGADFRLAEQWIQERFWGLYMAGRLEITYSGALDRYTRPSESSSILPASP